MADSLTSYAIEAREATGAETSEFHLGHVASISGGHFVHDLYSGFLGVSWY